MEGLRGMAALMVLMVHFHTLFAEFCTRNSWVLSVSHFLASVGHTGVDLFFVLSGYLIYGVMLKKDFQYFPYLYRRAHRLYPAFIGVFTIYVVLSYLFPQKSKLPEQMPELLLYLTANLMMLPGILPIVPMITAAWSLSYEWFFYITGPLFVLITGMRHRCSSRTRIAILLVLTVFYLELCFLGITSHPRLTMFLGGCLLWESVKGGLLRRFLTPWGEWAAAAAFLINLGLIGWLVSAPGEPMAVFAVSPGYYTGTLFTTSFFFVGYALFHNGWLTRFFSAGPLRWAGNISYSYYLIHGVVLHGIQLCVRIIVSAFSIPPSATLFVFLFLAGLVGTLLAGSVFYLMIEKRFLHFPAMIPDLARAGLSGERFYNFTENALQKEVK